MASVDRKPRMDGLADVDEHLDRYMPSSHEAERAVLGSDVGGVRELLPAGTGLLFEAGNPKDLARQCQVLLQSNDLRTDLGKRAREPVIENHHVDSMSQRYGKILGQITGHQPSLDGQPSLSYR